MIKKSAFQLRAHFERSSVMARIRAKKRYEFSSKGHFKENWFQNYTKDFLSESGYNGSHGINGNVNSHETVRDFLSSDG